MYKSNNINIRKSGYMDIYSLNYLCNNKILIYMIFIRLKHDSYKYADLV